MEIDLLRLQLVDLFAYELWANQRWESAVEALGDEGQAVWSHILFAQRIWYGRCLTEQDLPQPTDSVGADLATMAALWQELIRTSDPTAYISYQTFAGERYMSLLEDMARHVVNHGTYHRGQLREIASAAGCTYPETDYIIWKREC